MNIVLIQTKLQEHEIEALMQEFPQFLFLSLTELSYKKLDKDNWGRVEIIFGPYLNEDELKKAKQLRWIHTPTPDLARLCIGAIEDRGNIFVTTTKESNIGQVGEFVMGGILFYAKNFDRWKLADASPTTLWGSKWRDQMWQIKGKRLLQIGLGKIGTEITRRAQEMGMQTIGVKGHRSFHPYCQKTYAMSELSEELPKADVVSVAIPRELPPMQILGMRELEFMKDDSILILIGDRKFLDEGALHAVSKQGKFRGIIIDAPHQVPIPAKSPLWEIENLIITPEVATRPKEGEGISFHTFRHNMRQFIHDNFIDMRHVYRSL